MEHDILFAILLIFSFIIALVVTIAVFIVLSAKILSEYKPEEDSRINLNDWHKSNLDNSTGHGRRTKR